MESLTKQELYRRLMKEQKSKGPGVQKIDHPLAKYNSIGQLTCVICSLPVKSELLWQTHLQSKNHKENVVALKTLPLNKEKVTKMTTSSTSDSSPASSNDGDFVKPSLPPLTKRRHSNSSEEAPSLKKSKAAAGTFSVSKSQGLPTDFFDPPLSELVPNENSNNFNTPSIPPTNSVLPHDFFDNASENTEKSEVKDRDNKVEPEIKQDNERELPEGFFDDPKQDAKVRKVEYKDPYDSEWEAFQKSISKESEVSEAIVEEGDEEMKEGRELTEVNEQVHCFQRAENLRLRQESLFAEKHVKKETTSDHEQDVTNNSIVIKKERDNDDENGDDDDDADLNDLLNWRFKSS